MIVTSIPVVLLDYARPGHPARVLDCLWGNYAPLIHAHPDESEGKEGVAVAAEYRARLRGIGRCGIHPTERPENFGPDLDVLAVVADVMVDPLQADMCGFRSGRGGTLLSRSCCGPDNSFQVMVGMQQGIDSIPSPAA